MLFVVRIHLLAYSFALLGNETRYLSPVPGEFIVSVSSSIVIKWASPLIMTPIIITNAYVFSSTAFDMNTMMIDDEYVR